MSHIILPRRFTQQPQYPVAIDYTNPIAQGLQFAWSGGAWAATEKGILAPASGVDQISRIDARHGKGTVCSTTPLTFPYPVGSNFNAATSATIFGVALRTTDTTQTLYQQNDGFDRLLEGQFGTFGGMRMYISSDTNFTNQRALWNKTLSANRPYIGCVVWDGPDQFRGYVDGVSLGAPSLTGTTVTALRTNSEPVEFGKSLQAPMEASYFLSLAWNRALSEGEILSLTANPHQIFRRSQQVLYFDVGGGGSTGTIAATWENFTSSISGTTTIVGTIAQTTADFTSAITGTSEVPGTLAAFTEDAVGALEGTVGTGGVTGTITGLVADSTASITGTTTVLGTSASQMEDFLSSIMGTTTILGTITGTTDDAIMTANGYVGEAPAARRRTLVGMGE